MSASEGGIALYAGNSCEERNKGNNIASIEKGPVGWDGG